MGRFGFGDLSREQQLLQDEFQSWFGGKTRCVKCAHEDIRGRPFLRMKVTVKAEGRVKTLRDEFESFVNEGKMRRCAVYLDYAGWSGGIPTLEASVTAPLADNPLFD